MREAWASAGVSLASTPVPRAPARRSVAPHRRAHFPLTTCLASFAACLGALFAASIVLEAFDGDLALWPRGTEDFTAAPHGHLVRGAQGAGAFHALQPAHGFVITAGTLLVARYRARSALATDAPSISVRLFTMAEPWGPQNDWRPGARHFRLRSVRRLMGRPGGAGFAQLDSSIVSPR